MRKLFSTAVLCLLLIVSKAQVQTPRFNTVVNANCHGFYEYLPQGYDANGTTTYPLIIFAHGAGETGDGSNGQLQKVLANGIPKLINLGQFPMSFTVGGQTHKFIVISPQFIGWPSPADMNAVLDYAIAHYKVNTNRVYVTGLSMGGGATWEFAGHLDIYAQRIAAIVPVCGASWPEPQRAYKIAANNVAVWATHNNGDPTVPVHYTDDYVMHINSAPTPPAVPAKKTIFISNSHDAWTTTYSPSFTENGLNIYQWMLQFQRNGGTLPVALTEYKVFKSSASKATISWTTSEEINNHHFTIERSVDGIHFSVIGTVPSQNHGATYSFTDDQPLKGDNYYRLSQTDIGGAVKQFEVKKLRFDEKSKSVLVLSPNPAVSQLQIKLEQEEKGDVLIRLLSTGGSVVKQWTVSKTNYELNQTINVSDLSSGSYLLQVKGKNFTETQRFIKN